MEEKTRETEKEITSTKNIAYLKFLMGEIFFSVIQFFCLIYSIHFCTGTLFCRLNYAYNYFSCHFCFLDYFFVILPFCA